MNIGHVLTTLIALGTFALANQGIAQEVAPPTQQKGIYDTLAASEKHKTLVRLIDQAGLKDKLTGTGAKDQPTWTLLAPTDDAFAKVSKEVMDKLIADPKLLQKVLLYHILVGRSAAADLTDGLTPKTEQGETVKIKVEAGTIWVNGAKVTQSDVPAGNGLIHHIDIVLIPPKVAQELGIGG